MPVLLCDTPPRAYVYLTQQALLEGRGKPGSGIRGPSVNSGCLLPVAVVGKPGWLRSGSHRPRKRAPRTEGLTQAEVIPGLGEGCGQPGQHPVRRPIKLGVLCPGVRETALAGGGGPCSLQYSLTWLPNSHKTLFSFSTEPWREARKTPHTAQAQLPAASVALIMHGCDLLRADDAAVSCYALHEPLARSARTEAICWEETIVFFPFYSGGLKA